MNVPKPNSCLICKGSNPRRYCGRDFCPILAKAYSAMKVKQKITRQDFNALSPSILIGHNFYPNVNVGILSPPELDEKTWLYDAPRFWAQNEFKIPEIVDFRSALINSRFRQDVKLNALQKNKFLDTVQEVAMASKPVDIEVNLNEAPKFRLNLDTFLAPSGPNAKLKNIFVTSNPKIDTRVDKIVSDTDLKAKNAILELSKKGFDENFLTKLLSAATLGIKTQRKLVPTRWAISGVDSNIGNYLISKIKEYNQTDYLAFFGGYLGNYFLVLCFPEVFSYELFEMYMPKTSWNIKGEINYTTDYEPYAGRKTYAENCGGGFYSVRLALAEKLEKMKKQASVLVLRFITGEYAIPLGVWVVRESVRKALNNKPLEFSSKELMLNYAKLMVQKKFGYDIDNILNKSIILKDIKQQNKLSKFF